MNENNSPVLSILEFCHLNENKRLFHRVYDELEKKNQKMVTVMSLERGEGKSFFAAVLAIGFTTFLKKRVKIIDLSTSDTNVSAELIAQLGDLVSIPVLRPEPKNGKVHALDFDIKSLIDSYRDNADFIFIEAAAKNIKGTIAVDPLIVSKATGGVVLVTSKDSLSGGDYRGLKDNFENWGVSILGTIYNEGLPIA